MEQESMQRRRKGKGLYFLFAAFRFGFQAFGAYSNDQNVDGYESVGRKSHGGYATPINHFTLLIPAKSPD